MKVSKATIVRTTMLVIAIVNIVLEKCGIDIIKADENTLLSVVESSAELLAVLAAWWYNNSFSEKALKAQKYLEGLRRETADV